MPPSKPPTPNGPADAPARDESGPARLAGEAAAAVERRLTLDLVVDPKAASPRDRFEAAAGAVRDLLTPGWLWTQATYDRENPKRVYVLSTDYQPGRSLTNNLAGLPIEPAVRAALERGGLDLAALAEEEPDAGLGQDGAGRTASDLLDSLAALQIPAMGYGLRYEVGPFRQQLERGEQVERPDHWLRRPDPWEVARPAEAVQAWMACAVEPADGEPTLRPRHLVGVPYDRPVVGPGGKTVNTLRLWAAAAPDAVPAGDFFAAVFGQVQAADLTRILAADDGTPLAGRVRFAQEYFLVACSLADILRRFRQAGNGWRDLADRVAVQLHGTGAALAVIELMRVLLDEVNLGWDEAWDLTVGTLSYTDHTAPGAATARWPVEWFEAALPRHLTILYEINRRLLDDVRTLLPDGEARAPGVSMIEEGPAKEVRLAHLAVNGCHRTAGVAPAHTDWLRTHAVKDLADLFPGRFHDRTSGVSPRRWLLQANPALARLLTDALGDGWVTDLGQLRRLRPLADDPAFRATFRQAKRDAKARFATWLGRTAGVRLNPDTLFDIHVGPVSESRRQLLNVLHVIRWYDQLRQGPRWGVPSRTVLFAGKAAPADPFGKLLVKLIHHVADVAEGDPAVRGQLKVAFLPDYNVSLAERLIPAADVAQQLATAGTGAFGTAGMKFLMNGAPTVGTRDGTTLEIARAVGEDHLFLFGLTAEQVADSRGWYDPRWHAEHEPATRAALDLLAADHFSRDEPGVFQPVVDALLEHGDPYMHLADLEAYTKAQARVLTEYATPEAWARRAILNVAAAGPFSSDRTAAEYAADVWAAEPCPVP